MPIIAPSPTRIFEDPPAVTTSGYARPRPMEDTLLHDGQYERHGKTRSSSRSGHMSPSPLGERHINSPPHSRKVPLKSDNSHRPPMHKKSSSSSSFKALLRGKDRVPDDDWAPAATSDSPSKKSKSSTNLVGLLKKRSKKNLLDEKMESVSQTASRDLGSSKEQKKPISTKNPPQLQHTRRLPYLKDRKAIEQEILLYTPRDQNEINTQKQRDPYDYNDAAAPLQSPRRPFLEHKSSRSSIFTEELGDITMAPTENSKDEVANLSKAMPRQVSPNEGSGTEVPSGQSKTHTEGGKRSSRIFETIAALNMRSRREDATVPASETTNQFNPQELDSAMEKMLGRYDIPQNLREQLLNLKPEVKAGLMKGDRVGSGSSDQSLRGSDGSRIREHGRPGSNGEDSKESKRSRSRSRTRSRILSLSKRGDSSPSKDETRGRSGSKSRPKSIDMGWSMGSKGLSSMVSLGNLNTSDSAVTPGDFIHYLREVQKPALVEVGKIHKLRILLRNESVSWTDAFVKKGGMDEVVQLLYRIMDIEWREDHEDNLLHETLLCLKGLSTTKLAMQRLEEVGADLFPALLKMLFDPERKGPAEYNTRGVIISLIFSYLSATLHSSSLQHEERTRYTLSLLQDPKPVEDQQALDFVSQMHISRPYRVWCKEVTNVTKEVFWIFLHHMNVIPIGGPVNANETDYNLAYFPCSRAPHPAAPYVGGVEWEATQYLALHLDLLNGLIVSLPTPKERNNLRDELKQSGWEKVMGGSLRTCKEKFYGGVHDGLRSWVAAAQKDGWLVEDVRAGPPREITSPKKSPVKKGKHDEAPQLLLDVGAPAHSDGDHGWL